MTRRFLLTFALLAIVPADAAGEAIARARVVVDTPQVRLADLFDNAGPKGARVLGPAPAPGQRYIVPVAQLAAIARDHGLTMVGGGPTLVERPGRPIAREEAEAVLRQALAAAGAIVGAEAQLEIQPFTPPTVPLGATPQLVVEDLSWDQASGRFAATLTAIATGEQPARTRLTGRLNDLVAVPVTIRRLPAGTPVTASDVRIVRLAPDRVPADAVRDPAQLGGQVLRRTLPPGAPIGLSELGERLLVVKDQPVVMAIEVPGLIVTAQGRALEHGARGDVVRVLNVASRAVVEATVIGAGRVRVTPGSMPVSPPTDRRLADRRAEPTR
jgi:flagella basal body P-ring formation protein FlgA